jgi:HK97 family phage prohead protease
LETKTLALIEAKALDEGAGSVEGLASTWGGIDSYGDTVERGAYLDTIPSFLVDGFVAWSHDWQNPVATPTSAVETERGLYLTAAFHSDPEAQRARTITAERLARGKSMGLSIGYEALEWEMRKVETPYRGPFGELTDLVRVLKKIKLFEVSLVTVPADGAARVTGAKGYGLPFEAHSERVRVAVREYLERARSGSDLRGKEGRPISTARRERIATDSTQLRAVADDLDALLTETEPAPKGADLESLYLEFLHTQARLAGVPA